MSDRLKLPNPYQVRIAPAVRAKWAEWCRRAGVRQGPAVESALVAHMHSEDRLADLRAKMRGRKP